MALSFDRPGVWLSFSVDGGYSWTKPQAIIVGDPDKIHEHTCGNTSLVASDKYSFLIA